MNSTEIARSPPASTQLECECLPPGCRAGGGGGGGRRGRGGRTGRREQLRYGGRWYNTNAGALPLVKAIICAGLYPNVVRVLPSVPKPSRDGRPAQPRPPKLLNREGHEVFIHPISCNFDAKLSFPSPYLM
jgi:hypothetical protein